MIGSPPRIPDDPALSDYLRVIFQAIGQLQPSPVPAHDNSPGEFGQYAIGPAHLYICVAQDTWVRVGIAGGF